MMITRVLSFALIGLAMGATGPAADAPALSEKPRTTDADVESEIESHLEKQLFRGEVIFVTEALKRRGIRTYDELKGQVALETDSGELLPIIPDWRGRAFFQDERLRNRKVELIGNKRAGLPYLQVIMIFLFDEEGQRQYMDYWCDICSIPMYEIKPCDCCQGDIRLRLQPRELPGYLAHPESSRTPGVEPASPASASPRDG